jgi:hypothetical protein
MGGGGVCGGDGGRGRDGAAAARCSKPWPQAPPPPPPPTYLDTLRGVGGLGQGGRGGRGRGEFRGRGEGGVHPGGRCCRVWAAASAAERRGSCAGPALPPGAPDHHLADELGAVLAHAHALQGTGGWTGGTRVQSQPSTSPQPETKPLRLQPNSPGGSPRGIPDGPVREAVRGAVPTLVSDTATASGLTFPISCLQMPRMN